MAVSTRPSTRWYALPLACLLLFLSYAFVSLVYGELSFERALDSLSITFDDFDDFGPSYKDALTAAGKESFDYSFPPLSNTTSSTIPPIIHFIWFQDLYSIDPEANEMPHRGANTPDLCIKFNPTYEVNIWHEAGVRDLLSQHYAWFLPTYNSYKHPIQRVDAAKYFILYHYGGIYLDMDVSCRKGLDPLLNFPAWFPRAEPLGVNNDVMASRPRHPLMWKMLDSLRRRNRNLLSPYLTIWLGTGPRYTSDMLRRFLYEHGIYGASGSKAADGAHFMRSSDANAVYVLPQEFYSEQYTFFGHRPGGTCVFAGRSDSLLVGGEKEPRKAVEDVVSPKRDRDDDEIPAARNRGDGRSVKLSGTANDGSEPATDARTLTWHITCRGACGTDQTVYTLASFTASESQGTWTCTSAQACAEQEELMLYRRSAVPSTASHGTVGFQDSTNPDSRSKVFSKVSECAGLGHDLNDPETAYPCSSDQFFLGAQRNSRRHARVQDYEAGD